MAVLAECPFCHKRQTAKSKKCESKNGKGCGADLEKAKRSGKVKYWIAYRIPGGKQRFEKLTGENAASIEFARDADSKRKVQKRENRIFDIKPESKMTFQELTDWYLGLETVKALSSFSTVEIYLKKFNSEFGNVMVNQIKPSDMENLQAKRRAEGKADATVDHEIRAAKGVINKAFNDDLVSGDTLRAFKKVKKLLRPNSNARDKVISSAQFKALMESEKLPLHTKGILTTGYWTGMRRGEILSLVWPKVDMKKSFIYLDAKDTKEEKEKAIPIGVELHRVLETIPRALHDDHVFLYRGKPVRDIRAGIQEACKEAGIEYGRGSRDGFVFHDLRHTFITDMRKAGVERTVTMAITGHAIKDMNQRYDTVDEKDKLKAVAVLEVHRRKESASVDQNVDQART